MQIGKPNFSDIQGCRRWLLKLYSALFSGKIDFRDGNNSITDGNNSVNIKGQWQVITDTGSANTEFSVSHTLGQTPLGIIQIYSDKAGIVYDSGTAWTDTTIYLKYPSANSSIKILLI